MINKREVIKKEGREMEEKDEEYDKYLIINVVKEN